MLQPLRVSHRPLGGLITPAELRQALETMEAQHKSIEMQVATKSAQVEALVAQRTSFDVNFVSLQLETGTGTQLFARVQEKLDDLGASQSKVAVAAMDAVRWLVRLGYHAKGLEELHASQDDREFLLFLLCIFRVVLCALHRAPLSPIHVIQSRAAVALPLFTTFRVV